MTEHVTTREEQLEARAAEAGLTLIPPHEHWLVIYRPDADYQTCYDLDEVEKVIVLNGA